MSRFEGYSDAGLSLLKALPTFSKTEFQTSKTEWAERLFQPSLSLISELGDRLQSQVSPGIQAEPKVNGSFSPVHRDLRFAKDKSQLYKDHLLLNFWEGEPKKHAPTLRIRISNKAIGFAVGAAFSKDTLNLWRERISADSTGSVLHKQINEHIKAYGSRLAEPQLKKVPSPFPAEHERSQLLRCKNFQLRFSETTPSQICSSEFSDWCFEKLNSFKGIHQWLITNTIP